MYWSYRDNMWGMGLCGLQNGNPYGYTSVTWLLFREADFFYPFANWCDPTGRVGGGFDGGYTSHAEKPWQSKKAVTPIGYIGVVWGYCVSSKLRPIRAFPFYIFPMGDAHRWGIMAFQAVCYRCIDVNKYGQALLQLSPRMYSKVTLRYLRRISGIELFCTSTYGHLPTGRQAEGDSSY